MNKITIEITENGWTETLHYGGKEYTKRNKRTRFGSEGLDKCWEDDDSAPDFAYEAFESLSSGCHDAMYALYGADHHDDAE